jgi:ferric-dicitrate binding protein FerR (iron transport regulator)
VTKENAMDRDRAHALMMAALDGEASADDRRELDALLAHSPELAAEWRRLERLKEVTAGMTLRNAPEEVWDRYWTSTYSRVERGLGWLLLAAGALVLAGYWIWHVVEAFLAETGTPLFLRVAIAAVAVGGLILLVSVIREKIHTARRDPYQKEVIR